MPSSAELLNPAQVCKTLGVTPSGVRRLAREGYLEVKDTVRFKNGPMDLFGVKQVQGLLSAMPRIKQTWETQDKSLYGAHRMAKSGIHRLKSYNDKLNHKEQFLTTLYSLSENTEKIIRACYYLFHLNHYAKAGNQYLYDLKEAVLHSLVENYFTDDHLLQVSFIEGDNKINLCPECKAQAKDRGMSYLEYMDATGGCPKCTREYKYYSLYEFIISYGDYRFCFHTPYASGKRWFKKTGIRPPLKPKLQREGAYAFGRAIYESEAQAVELPEVIEELQSFLSNFDIKPLIETETTIFE